MKDRNRRCARADHSPNPASRPWGRGLRPLWLAPFGTRTHHAHGSIVSGGRRRSFLLHLPPNYDPATPAPLVICIHGFAEWPAHQMRISRWNDLADRHGFIVVYPGGTGIPRRWYAGGWGAATDLRDVTFIADLIDTLAARYSIDRTRIYANGLSNGGGMSCWLACQLGDRIAAVGSVAGALVFPVRACPASRPMPLIAFHGTADRIVPYEGGQSTPLHPSFPNVPAWIAAWAEHNGCAATPTPLPSHGAATGIRYGGCRDEAEVVFYTIAGGGHSWPGGEPLPRFIVGHTSPDIDATAVMWEFFSRHALTGEARSIEGG